MGLAAYGSPPYSPPESVPGYLVHLAKPRNREECRSQPVGYAGKDVGAESTVVCDGVVPRALVDGLHTRCLPERARDAGGHARRSRKDAEAAAARVVAGCMCDVARCVEAARSA